MILYAFLMLRHFSTFVDCFPRKFYTIFIHFLNHCMSHYLSPTATPHKYTPKKQVKILFIKAFSPVLNLIAPLNSLSVSRQSHVTPAPAKSYSPLRFSRNSNNRRQYSAKHRHTQSDFPKEVLIAYRLHILFCIRIPFGDKHTGYTVV